MRIAALRKEPGKAPANVTTPHSLPVLRSLPSVAKPSSSADYAPPPLRLGRADLDRNTSSNPLSASSLSVSSPHDAAEREASSTASKIVRMPARSNSTAYVSTATNTVFRLVRPASDHEPLTIKERGSALGRSALTIPLIARSPSQATIQRQTASDSRRSGRVEANINASMSGGEPLPIGVRQFMEPRFGADFSNVRIHKSSKAAALNRQLNARAFTTQNHIFFGQDKFKPESSQGKELIAHELTHTIQQGAAVQQSGNVQRSEDVTVRERPSAKLHGLWGIDSVLDYFADKANLIPGFRMFTVILGMNPVNGSQVDRSAANILRAMIEVMPGGSLVSEALANHGIFDKVGTFVEQQVDALGMVGSSFKQAIDQFIEGFDLTDLADPGGLWERAKSIFTGPIDQLIDFAGGLVSGIVDLVKEVILKPIAQLAEGTEGYALLKAVMGKDPITGDPYPQTAENIIGPFLKLIGQDEIWENMQKSGAIPKCFAWFKGALSELMGFVNEIPGLFVKAFTELELEDIVLVPRAFAKLAGVFGDFLGRFTSWVGDKIWKLLEIVFEVVKPGAFEYVKKTGAALKSILQNPLPFVGNLVKAAKLGFQNFAGNFLTHLKRGLIDWLTGSLPGVYIPKALTLPEIGKLALSVLGITWAQIRGKIVKALGPSGEKIMQGLEALFDVVVALKNGGPAAAWEVIKDKLTGLKDQVISGITSLIVEIVVTKAVPKVVAMFIPGAGFISAIVSIYDTIMVFVNKIKKIIQVVTAFIDSIVAIAGGAIGAAAGRVESVLAGLLSLAIAFLAGFAGGGKVADKVMGVIGKVRATVDKAIDTAIAWIVAKAKSLFKKLLGKEDDKRTDAEKTRDVKAAADEGTKLLGAKGATPDKVRSKLPAIRSKFKLTTIDLVKAGAKYHITAVINPTADGKDVPIGGTFKEAPGGYRAHQLHQINSPSGIKVVHLIRDHGPAVDDAAMKARLNGYLQSFHLARQAKIDIQLDIIRGHNETITETNALIAAQGGVPTVKQTDKITRATAKIADANALIAKYNAINVGSRHDVFKHLSDWKVKPLPSPIVTKFVGEIEMDQAVTETLKANQANIDTGFSDGSGGSKPEGFQITVRHKMPINVGTGWEFDPAMNIVQVGYPLTGVELHLMVSSPADFEYKVLTGYAVP
jgi:hypothetical protein